MHTGKRDRVKARKRCLEQALVQGWLLDEKGALDLDVLLEAERRVSAARGLLDLVHRRLTELSPNWSAFEANDLAPWGG